ncbi:MAG: cellobiose phosphorylase [Candidatus Omnitrophica bacterium]|nr:cellobiose phosphorylase [Candidatus Omnitrophota bacterium]
MSDNNDLYKYLDQQIAFRSEKAADSRLLYFPLCGIDSAHLKSSITPFLSGDIKIDKERFLTKPSSREDLRQNLRNIFFNIKNQGIISLADDNDDDVFHVEAGPLWHKVIRTFSLSGLEIEALNFVPVTGENVELMRVQCLNISDKTIFFTPTSSIPIFGRALVNKHDHEHVTALLHRIKQLKQGVLVEPVMSFNEEGHLPNKTVYYVFGFQGMGENPVGTFPTVESFVSDGGPYAKPQAVFQNKQPGFLSDSALQGKEAMGALRFKEYKLNPGDTVDYYFMLGIEDDNAKAMKVYQRFDSPEKFQAAFDKNKEYWQAKSSAITFSTRDDNYNAWLQWVSLQPVLRRIYGCSFLPDHDYGKGGKGWRDIWQDLLSLILIEPENVRGSLINNFAGVRIDGSNATIIGSAPGEFVADRNAIARVWMDHGVWPLMTVLLYIHQTGDFQLLLEENVYFKDHQLSRNFEKDIAWSPQYGQQLKDKEGQVYKGSILEHILVQHLVQFFNVGEHNIIRLENADWNDGYDMAFERGESVAFMSFYGGNLIALAECLEALEEKMKLSTLEIAEELLLLLDVASNQPVDYSNAVDKRSRLFENYLKKVQPVVSGKKCGIKIVDLVKDLRQKGEWIFSYIKTNEKINVQDQGQEYTWYNGYYDNQGKKVEGEDRGHIRMILASSVFPIMSGLANLDEVRQIIKAVDEYLQDEQLGGYRLNTNFQLNHYLDMGRAFGFAYGTKENGAFFSHMAVMYAYALYKRGFVREGSKVIRSIYNMCVDTAKSKIYPGIPEYIDSEGRGMYHYLTGSASWLVLTELTQKFGVSGQYGNLLLAPKLVKEDFNEQGEVKIECYFAQKRLTVIYINSSLLDFGEYKIKDVFFNEQTVAFEPYSNYAVLIKKEILQSAPRESVIKVHF